MPTAEPTTQPTTDSWLAEVLQHCRPQRVLCVCPWPLAALQDWVKTTGGELKQLRTTDLQTLGAVGHYDLAVVAGAVETSEWSRSLQLLGIIHNLCSNRLCLLLDKAAETPERRRDLRALGLRCRGELAPSFAARPASAGSWVAYDYALEDYNPRRRWNNPEHWANPENFDKFRW